MDPTPAQKVDQKTVPSLQPISRFFRDHAELSVERLTNLTKAVDEWYSSAKDRIGLQQMDAEFESDEFLDWFAEHRGKELSEVLAEQRDEELNAATESKRYLCAGIAVSIASTTDTFGEHICRFMKFPYNIFKAGKDKGKVNERPNWGHLTAALQDGFGIELKNLLGHNGNEHARLLGNCFKHNGGRAKAKLAEAIGIPANDPVKFEEQDWPKMIEDTRLFLYALADVMASEAH